jgi:predicted patatin/cPLA2 family phospholipase
MHERRRKNSPLTPIGESRPDGERIALVVEGGGMRGCVSAGMVTAIHYLGLEDTFDVIYGSSAGTIIGAYFNTRQLPWFGPEVYYDSLTTAGSEFIDKKRLLRSLGLGLLDPRLYKDVLTRRGNGKPVLNLDFLLRETMQAKKPLDWEKFVEMQKVQPVKVVASALKKKDSIVLSMENGAFSTLEELACCMQSSCLLPGIAGPLMNLNTSKLGTSDSDKFIVGNNIDEPLVEPLADALVFEALPYRTAINEGATNVVVLRTRPDGVDVVGKTSPFEKLIFNRFFGRKNKQLKDIKTHMRTHQHKKSYGKQVLELNEFANLVSDDGTANVMTVAIPPGSPEVGRLETGREAIFEGVRRGFARAYDCLVEDPSERGRGHIVAKQVFPDEIMDYDPASIDGKSLAAFHCFLEEKESNGEKNSRPSFVGKTALEAKLPR